VSAAGEYDAANFNVTHALRRVIEEMDEQGVLGWGNACRFAAEHIDALTARLAKAEAELAEAKKWEDELVEERLQEINAEAEAFDKECWQALKRLCEEQPGFDWRDYPDGLTAADALDFMREHINGIVDAGNRRAERAESALASVEAETVAGIVAMLEAALKVLPVTDEYQQGHRDALENSMWRIEHRDWKPKPEPEGK
jgi:hypothetical protein